MSESPEELQIDGRLLRSTRTRAKIVAAVREIIAGGNSYPSLEEVAAEAGVGLRTVYRHFEDLDGLHEALQTILAAEVVPLLVPEDYEGTLSERVHQLVAQRVRVFEKIAPFRLATGPREEQTERLRRSRTQLAAALRNLSVKAVGDELRTVDGELAVAFEALLSVEAWDSMRRWQGVGRERAIRAFETGALQLLSRRS